MPFNFNFMKAVKLTFDEPLNVKQPETGVWMLDVGVGVVETWDHFKSRHKERGTECHLYQVIEIGNSVSECVMIWLLSFS